MNSTAAARAGIMSAALDFTGDAGLPTLPLPRNTWAGALEGCYLYDKKTLQVTAKTPEVDPVISEYGQLFLSVRFTLRFIEFVNQKYFLYQLVFDNQRFNYALDVYRTLNNFSLMEIDPNEAKVRETILFYLTSQTLLINQSSFEKLKTYGESLAAVYTEKLGKVEYTLGNKREKLTAGEMASFIKDLQDKVETHLNQLFQSTNSKTSEQGLPKPDAIELPVGLTSVTPDLLVKINPSLPQSRADDLAPYLNRAISESQISTSIGEAMFLAQVLHEMGVKTDLNEGGGKKSYGGKVYDYFFYMYDKDSPNPDRVRVATKVLGNDEAGDGAKYHGRGYIQLTGKKNYRAAGEYLGLDLINNPDLANDPKNSVRIAAWFWLFGNGNLNKYTDKDSEANFQSVTTRINGGLTNYEDRKRLYANAKKVLGIR